MTNRYLGPQYLRGLAAFMVLFAHWSGIGLNPVVQHSELRLTIVPPATTANLFHVAHELWTKLASWTWVLDINPASGGVLLFFLISGFVIPISVEKLRPAPFLIRRGFRLLPCVWFAIAAWLSLNLILQRIGYAVAPNIGWADVLSNGLLVHDWYWIPHIDVAFWTLLVEVKFYVAMAAMVVLAQRVSLLSIAVLVGTLLAFAVPFFDRPGSSDYEFLLTLSGQTSTWWVFYFFRVLNNNSPFMIFMLAGTAMFLWHQNRVTFAAAAIVSIILLALFATTFLIGPNGTAQVPYVEEGARALLLFTAVVAADKAGLVGYLPRWIDGLLSWLASISYPLYLLHGSLGMSTAFAVYYATGNVNVGPLAAGLLVFPLAFAVHKLVEEPGQRLGGRVVGWAGKLKSRGAPPRDSAPLADD